MGIHFNVDLSFWEMKHFINEVVERELELATMKNYESVVILGHRVQRIKNKLEVY